MAEEKAESTRLVDYFFADSKLLIHACKAAVNIEQKQADLKVMSDAAYMPARFNMAEHKQNLSCGRQQLKSSQSRLSGCLTDKPTGCYQ
jgi:hypothetical protein